MVLNYIKKSNIEIKNKIETHQRIFCSEGKRYGKSFQNSVEKEEIYQKDMENSRSKILEINTLLKNFRNFTDEDFS